MYAGIYSAAYYQLRARAGYGADGQGAVPTLPVLAEITRSFGIFCVGAAGRPSYASYHIFRAVLLLTLERSETCDDSGVWVICPLV